MPTTMIPIKSIDVPPGNRDSIDADKLQGLAETMRESGQLAPILVRANGKKGRFELIAGERRLRAAEILKWKEIEAKELNADDRRAEEVHAIENLQREDLTPWEEARKLAALAGSNGSTVRVEDLAARLGRPPQWVAVRLAVNKLIPELRQLVTEQEWPLTHLPLLARVPADFQPAVLEAIREAQEMDIGDDWGYFDNKTHKHVPGAPRRQVLIEFLEEYQRLLSTAPWKLDDPFLLPQAGSCDQCKKRTSAQTLLFPELVDATKKTDRCLDEGCWKAKQANFIAVTVDKLRTDDKNPVLLKDSYREVPNELAAAIGPATFEKIQDYDVCKKTDKGAVPAVIVTGDEAGTVKYVKPCATGKTGNSGKKPARPVDQETGEPEPPSTQERLRQLELKRKCKAAEIWSEKLETFKPKWTGLLDALILHFGCEETREHRHDGGWEEFDNRDRKIKLETIAWQQLWPIFQSRLHRFGPMTQGDEIWEEAVCQARALGMITQLQYYWHDATVDVPMTKALIESGVADPGKAFKEAIK